MPKQSASDRLRAICLALPEAEEVAGRRGPTYRIEGKIFALDRRHARGTALWCKVPAGAQAILISADPSRFFSPPYYGVKGWIGLVLDGETDWTEATALIHRSYGLVAPKRFAAHVKASS
jgi:predicted DNA-binding protein (MmcQ/YjbR family)